MIKRWHSRGVAHRLRAAPGAALTLLLCTSACAESRASLGLPQPPVLVADVSQPHGYGAGRSPRETPTPEASPHPKAGAGAGTGNHGICALFKLPGSAAEVEAAVPIADPTDNLRPFYRALYALYSRKPGKKKVRIAFYGDSNLTNDYATSHLRQFLGPRFGHGGHGFITAGRHVPWYQHQEIRAWHSKGWRTYAVTTPRAPWNLYGHAASISFGWRFAALARFSSGTDGSARDQLFSRMDLHTLCWPRGGRLKVVVDGKELRELNTRCRRNQFVQTWLTVPQGRHKVTLKVDRPVVAVFGIGFENDDPGIVVDSLGIGALSSWTLQKVQREYMVAGLKARGYDLVILHMGTNMWAPGLHAKLAGKVITNIRAALGPKVPILLLSPPPFAKWKRGRIQGHPRMKACAREKRAIARANNLAFWDYFKSIGGQHAVRHWRKRRLFNGGLVHLKEGLHQIMMNRLGRRLMTGFAAFLKTKGIACSTR